MIGTYKDFYNFIRIQSPYYIELWEKFNNDPDPQEGDLYQFADPNIQYVQYSVMHTMPMKIGKFVKVEFDNEFKNGIAFYYIFDCNGEIVKIHSINDVEDVTKLTLEEQLDLFGFWKRCIRVINKN